RGRARGRRRRGRGRASSGAALRAVLEALRQAGRGAGGCLRALRRGATESVMEVEARKKWILFSVVTFLSLAADQATKIWSRATLPVSPANCDVPYDLMSHKCMGVAKPVIDGYWD